VVDEVLTGLRPELDGRQIEWKIGKLPFVEADPSLLRQVFTNLLSNAVKYTRPRDHAFIEVGSMPSNGTPCIFVRDNGVGFNMKYAEKLFGIFQRLHRQEDFEELALAWLRSSGSFTNMAAVSGQKQNWTKGRPSTSRWGQGKRNRKIHILRDER
jgi:light-regulated signal transduction histidine kinase (bacteriophytochrome)